MRNGKFYDDLKELNQSLYHGVKDFKNFIAIDSFEDNTGIKIGIYHKDNEYYFVILGTNILSLKKDWQANRAMCEGKIPKQYYSAEKFYKAIKDKYPNIIFTGYSLGGSIAQMLGSTFGNETVCFEPYGTKNLKQGKYSNNIINFGNFHDWVFTVNFQNQIGKTQIMDVNADSKEAPNWYWHQYHLYDTPSKAKPFYGEPPLKSRTFNTINLTNHYKTTEKQIMQNVSKAKKLIKTYTKKP